MLGNQGVKLLLVALVFRQGHDRLQRESGHLVLEILIAGRGHDGGVRDRDGSEPALGEDHIVVEEPGVGVGLSGTANHLVGVGGER